MIAILPRLLPSPRPIIRMLLRITLLWRKAATIRRALESTVELATLLRLKKVSLSCPSSLRSSSRRMKSEESPELMASLLTTARSRTYWPLRTSRKCLTRSRTTSLSFPPTSGRSCRRSSKTVARRRSEPIAAGMTLRRGPSCRRASAGTIKLSLT